MAAVAGVLSEGARRERGTGERGAIGGKGRDDEVWKGGCEKDPERVRYEGMRAVEDQEEEGWREDGGNGNEGT